MGAAACTNGRHPRARAYLYNNPRFGDCLTNVVKGEDIVVEAFPWLEVLWSDLPAGCCDLGATVLDAEQRELIAVECRATSRKGAIRWAIELDGPLPNAWVGQLWARQASSIWEQNAELRVHGLSGKVTDFEGEPKHAVVCANGPRGIATCTGEDGAYQLWLPDRRIPSLLAADRGYSRTSLECWVYDYRPRGHLALDVHIGELEVYELHAWRGYAGIKVDFIPMSIGLINAWLAEGRARRAAGCWPELSLSDIVVELDGSPTEILSLHKRDEVLRSERAPEFMLGSRPEYALQVADDPSHADCPQVLRVGLRHEFSRGSRCVLERGEGFFLGLT